MNPTISIRATNPDGLTAEISAICKSISWQGDARSVARMLSYSPVLSTDSISLPVVPAQLGGSACFSVNGSLLMDAWAVERTRDSLSEVIDVVAYDRGLWLKRNEKYMRVESQTPETVTAELCKEFGISVGTLASTGVQITRNFLGVSIYKIIMTMYTLAADQTGDKYMIRFDGAALSVVKMEQNAQSILLKPGCNLLGLTTKESVSAMTNSVAIYDDDLNVISTQQDTSAISLYGLMQAAIKASNYDDPVAHAKAVLKDNGMKTTISLTAIGNPKLITGNTVVVQEPATDTYGLFWITGDVHTWRRGVYQTKLSLSLEALMDKQTAGSVPAE